LLTSFVAKRASSHRASNNHCKQRIDAVEAVFLKLVGAPASVDRWRG
jgi:hypothetical protein